MLTPGQVELIHQEIDGVNTPEGSAAARALVAGDPEARALDADLRRVARVLGQVEGRAPPPGLKAAILKGLELPARASPNVVPGWSPFAALRSSLSRQRTVGAPLTEPMENAVMTKKTMLIGSTVVAAAVVVAALVTGFPPTGGTSGTIGGDPGIPGVQQASRYRGRQISPSEVNLQNPEIAVLLQNPDVLKLVTSEAFRTVMASEAFRTAQASEAFRTAQASEALRTAMATEAFRTVM
ncbi:MAG TPA: hypothetical protein VG940_11185, partial [Gemmatimonadales bacterium]|nr:hypothetical protein [Gemmatimonadales bacterium]